MAALQGARHALCKEVRVKVSPAAQLRHPSCAVCGVGGQADTGRAICLGPVCVPVHLLLAFLVGVAHQHGYLKWFKREWVMWSWWRAQIRRCINRGQDAPPPGDAAPAKEAPLAEGASGSNHSSTTCCAALDDSSEAAAGSGAGSSGGGGGGGLRSRAAQAVAGSH